jgi:hypothetical protein
MLLTKDHSLDLGRGTAVLKSDPGLGEQYIHTDYGLVCVLLILYVFCLCVRVCCIKCTF